LSPVPPRARTAPEIPLETTAMGWRQSGRWVMTCASHFIVWAIISGT
jgi:hypothetical protein